MALAALSCNQRTKEQKENTENTENKTKTEETTMDISNKEKAIALCFFIDFKSSKIDDQLIWKFNPNCFSNQCGVLTKKILCCHSKSCWNVLQKEKRKLIECAWKLPNFFLDNENSIRKRQIENKYIELRMIFDVMNTAITDFFLNAFISDEIMIMIRTTENGNQNNHFWKNIIFEFADFKQIFPTINDILK